MDAKMSDEATTQTEPVAVEAGGALVIVATFEQATSPLPVTALDAAVTAAIREGWVVVVDSEPMQTDAGETKYLTVLERA